MTPITKDFFLEEFLASETAARLGVAIVPTPEERANIIRLCQTLLQPIRSCLGRSMVITSGLRPLWLNLRIGGSPTSAHMHGLAADVKIVGMAPAAFCRWIQQHVEAEDWPIDQCIMEFGQWTHLSVRDKPRMQFLTAKSINGATAYTNGIT
jgi:hypothetical protein